MGEDWDDDWDDDNQQGGTGGDWDDDDDDNEVASKVQKLKVDDDEEDWDDYDEKEEKRLAEEKKKKELEEEERKKLVQEAKKKADEAKGDVYVALEDKDAERARLKKIQMETDGADDLFGDFVKKDVIKTDAKDASKSEEDKRKIVYEDEFDAFHLSTQENCEKLCGIIIEKLEKAGTKGHMRGCEGRFVSQLTKALSEKITQKDLEALQVKLAAAIKQKKVELAEKSTRAGTNQDKHKNMIKNVSGAQALLDERFGYDDDDEDDDGPGELVGDFDENGDYVEGYWEGKKWVEMKRYKHGTFDPNDYM